MSARTLIVCHASPPPGAMAALFPAIAHPAGAAGAADAAPGDSGARADPPLQGLAELVREGRWTSLDDAALPAGGITAWRAPRQAPGVAWSMPQESALARELGLAGSDGAWPLEAARMARDGFDPGADAWARITPLHAQVGLDSARALDPQAMGLDETASRALFDTARESFDAAGVELQWVRATHWRARHAMFEGLRAPSVERVVADGVSGWFTPDDVDSRLLRRLQVEVQMAWHAHPVNEARQAAGLPAVNTFWWSDCGSALGVRWPGTLTIDDSLGPAARAGDWLAWAQALVALDARLHAMGAQARASGDALRVLLCGQTMGWECRLGGSAGAAGDPSDAATAGASTPRSLLERARRLWSAPTPAAQRGSPPGAGMSSADAWRWLEGW